MNQTNPAPPSQVIAGRAFLVTQLTANHATPATIRLADGLN
jgi:hypothetical protein